MSTTDPREATLRELVTTLADVVAPEPPHEPDLQHISLAKARRDWYREGFSDGARHAAQRLDAALAAEGPAPGEAEPMAGECSCGPKDKRGWRDPHCPKHGEFLIALPPQPVRAEGTPLAAEEPAPGEAEGWQPLAARLSLWRTVISTHIREGVLVLKGADAVELMNDVDLAHDALKRPALPPQPVRAEGTPLELEKAEPPQTTHELKVWPESWEPLASGRKTFEVRHDDRGFKVGDILHLREWNNRTEQYTGREMHRRITYVLAGYVGLPTFVVVLALSPGTPPARDLPSPTPSPDPPRAPTR